MPMNVLMCLVHMYVQGMNHLVKEDMIKDIGSKEQKNVEGGWLPCSSSIWVVREQSVSRMGLKICFN
mgnify:CR=1 FL=1